MKSKKVKNKMKKNIGNPIRPISRSIISEISISADNVYKKDFPLLTGPIVYLDSAATTQKPFVVINALKDFYETTNANVHRGIYKISENATAKLEDARKIFAKFINAMPEEIIFTKNATEGFNQLANSLERTIGLKNIPKILKKYNIVTTEIEHHSNFIPWQQLSKRMSIGLRVTKYNKLTQNIEDISQYVDENTLFVAFTHMSNVTGLIVDAKEVIAKIRNKNPNAIIIIDATQIVAHRKIDVKDLDADFICFSAHKMYGTTGVGIVYGKKSILEKLEPFFYGGNMIKKVSVNNSEWADVPEKFEAGTIDTPGIFASSEAIKYISSKGFDKLILKEEDLKKYVLKKFSAISEIKVIGHTEMEVNRYGALSNYGPVISFTLENVHPHDLATICDEHNVCIRAGHHCAQPFMNALGVNATSRISISFYNTEKDIDILIESIKRAIHIFKNTQEMTK